MKSKRQTERDRDWGIRKRVREKGRERDRDSQSDRRTDKDIERERGERGDLDFYKCLYIYIISLCVFLSLLLPLY